MHYLVKLLVKADNEEEALEAAERDGNSLVEQGEFDWFTLDGRWDKSVAVKLDSDKGKALVKEGMEASRRDFDKGLEAVKYMLENFSDDDIYNQNFGNQRDSEIYLSRDQFRVVAGDSNCPCIFALDGDLWGSRIDNDKDLEYILNKDTENLWIVPVDFHN